MSAFSERVYACVRRIPKGRIINYGSVAAMAGRPRAARGVGYALSHLPSGTDVPWWRVVNRRGAISTSRASGLAQRQRALLEREGIVFDVHGEASWERFGWDPYE
ncbi:MAG: methylated-DNA--[protein]-cysteine S-methyltransferase [Gemmatimonadota bacterium]|nr:methylated-DNA--[protein]-cysteine S-methyltransferase [Gemmatimonadota bacterium]